MKTENSNWDDLKLAFTVFGFVICVFAVLPLIWLFPGSKLHNKILERTDELDVIVKQRIKEWEEEDKSFKEM